jgi:competence protein ComEC
VSFFQSMQKILLALSLLLIGGAAWQLWPAGEPVAMVAFLDIGQGDAIFIESPTGQQMLVDGGPDPSVLAELSQVMPMFDRSIDVVVATHPDSDHIAGLLSVLETYEVDQVLTTGSTAETDVFQSLYEAVSLEESTVTLVRRGSVIDWSGCLLSASQCWPLLMWVRLVLKVMERGSM